MCSALLIVEDPDVLPGVRGAARSEGKTIPV